MILIVSNRLDPHCDAVIRILHERGISFFRLNTEDIPQNAVVTFQKRSAEITVWIRNDGREIKLDWVKSIWYRRPKTGVISTDIADTSLRELAEKETKATLAGLLELMSEKFWVSYPSNISRASSKMYQLKVADSLGFLTPDTLITNDPGSALNFIKAYPDVVTKPLISGFVKREDGESIIYTNIVTQKEISSIDFVKYTPTFFQNYIDKSFELRITVVGDKIFACKIDSQSSKKTRHDWRRYDFENVSHSEFLLPEDIREKCLSLTKKLGLNFGAIDLIVTPSGDYVFLEINPNGQWLWIEKITGLPISNALVELLK